MSDCQTCGACCDHFEVVDVYPDDTNFGYLKSADLLRKTEYGFYAMKSISEGDNRCIALEGTVGESVRCTIYDNRPRGCRIFEQDSAICRTTVFVEITRKGKSLFTDDPDSWMKPAA